MPCPDCRSPSGEFRVAEFVETHGLDCGPYERFYEEFVICSDCDGRFDAADWPLTTPIVYFQGEHDPATPLWQSALSLRLSVPSTTLLGAH